MNQLSIKHGIVLDCNIIVAFVCACVRATHIYLSLFVIPPFLITIQWPGHGDILATCTGTQMRAPFKGTKKKTQSKNLISLTLGSFSCCSSRDRCRKGVVWQEEMRKKRNFNQLQQKQFNQRRMWGHFGTGWPKTSSPRCRRLATCVGVLGRNVCWKWQLRYLKD